MRILVLKRLARTTSSQVADQGRRPTCRLEARQKHGKSHHGDKLSINVDKRYKVIRKIETSMASAYGSQTFDSVLDSFNTRRDVFADKGLPERGIRCSVEGRGVSQPHPTQGRVQPSSDRRPGERVNFAMTLMATCDNLKRLAYMKAAGVVA